MVICAVVREGTVAFGLVMDCSVVVVFCNPVMLSLDGVLVAEANCLVVKGLVLVEKPLTFVVCGLVTVNVLENAAPLLTDVTGFALELDLVVTVVAYDVVFVKRLLSVAVVATFEE